MKLIASLLISFSCISAISITPAPPGPAYNIINRSLTDSSLAIVYFGADNIIDTYPALNEPHLVQANMHGGMIINIGEGKYIIRPHQTDSCTITILKNGNVVAQRTFRIKLIPAPVACLKDVKGTRTDKKQLLKSASVQIILPDCYLRHDLSAVSYKIDIRHWASDFSYSTINYSPSLTKQQIDIISECKPSTSITLSDVKIKGMDGLFNKALTTNSVFIDQ